MALLVQCFLNMHETLGLISPALHKPAWRPTCLHGTLEKLIGKKMRLIVGMCSLVYDKTIKSNSPLPQKGSEHQGSPPSCSTAPTPKSLSCKTENTQVASLRDALGSVSSERRFAGGETVSPGLGQGWSGTPRGGRTPAVPFVTRELQVEERALCAWDIFSKEEGKGLPGGSPQQPGKSVCGRPVGIQVSDGVQL